MIESPELWRVDRVAKRLGCGEPYVRKLVFEKRIPFIKLGHRTLRFSPEAIERWLESKEEGGGDV